MPIDYCHVEGGNFGDDLNRTLWRRIFPDIDLLAADVMVAGIGTILSGKPAAGLRKVVLGAGADSPHIKLNVANSDVRWVRGPHSARAVGAPAHLGLGDPAWLYPELYETLDAGRSDAVGLIPHWKTWKSFDWAGVAAQAGLVGIDASLSPAHILRKMRGCSRILTESLHGAVFADAMGIPWAPAVFAHRFHRFKWEDWSASIKRPFAPFIPDRALVHRVGPVKSLRNRLARQFDFQMASRYPSMRAVKSSAPEDAEQVAAQLFAFCADRSNFSCSHPFFVKSQKERMLEVCAKFAGDYGLAFKPDSAVPYFRINPREIKTNFTSNNNNYVWD